MRKLFFLLSLVTVIFIGCKKSNNTNNNIGVPPSPLVANAGPDTIITAPLPGTGFYFYAILNGKASHDRSGKIVSFWWTQIDPDLQTGFSAYYSVTSVYSDSTGVTFFEFPNLQNPKSTVHKFRLEVRDDLDNDEFDTVTITVNRKFSAEFDGITWDSTVGSLTYLNVTCKPIGILACQAFALYYPETPDMLNICTFNGGCDDIRSWKTIPYVSYDSIKLTDKQLFYSTNNDNNQDILNDNDWVVIYATPNAGIDFTQTVSIGVERLH